MLGKKKKFKLPDVTFSPKVELFQGGDITETTEMSEDYDHNDYGNDAYVGEAKNEVADDPVHHPAHYTDGKIEMSDYIADKNFNFFRGSAIKYITRAGKKDPNKEQEDLEKAIWYLQREIHRIGGYELKPNPLENVTIMVPHWADQQAYLQQFEEAFLNVYHDGMDAQALADNLSAEMKQESLLFRNGN